MRPDRRPSLVRSDRNHPHDEQEHHMCPRLITDDEIDASAAPQFFGRLLAIPVNQQNFIAAANDNASCWHPIPWTSPWTAELRLIDSRKEMQVREAIEDQLVLYGFEDRAPGMPLRGLSAQATGNTVTAPGVIPPSPLTCAHCTTGRILDTDKPRQRPDGEWVWVHQHCWGAYLTEWKKRQAAQMQCEEISPDDPPVAPN
jgi:hypothetical protein